MRHSRSTGWGAWASGLAAPFLLFACADSDPGTQEAQSVGSSDAAIEGAGPRTSGRAAPAPVQPSRPKPGVATEDAGAAVAAEDAGVEFDDELPAIDDEPRFSFFVTSLAGLRRLSGSANGFGGDLRYGQAHGLTGADKICSELAASSSRSAGKKRWRAFLSAVAGPGGVGQVNAIDRIGEGPWYDRVGRMVARDRDALLHDRPQGADPLIVDDLPNEFGVPNHTPDPNRGRVDNHHMLTGTDSDGTLHNDTATCADWSSSARSAGRPRVGFSWPSDTRRSWMSQMDESGCLPGVNVDQEVSPDPGNPTVGSGGGYGGFYCFAQ